MRPASSAAFGAAGGDVDRRRLVGQRVEARVLDRVVAAAVADEPALPEPRASPRPPPPASPAARPALGQRSPRMCSLRFSPVPTPRKKRPGISAARGRGGLGDDRRVDPHRRAGDAGAERSRSVACAIAAEHAHTNGLCALLVDPGVEVVGDEREGEARLLGARALSTSSCGVCSSHDSA